MRLHFEQNYLQLPNDVAPIPQVLSQHVDSPIAQWLLVAMIVSAHDAITHCIEWVSPIDWDQFAVR